MSTSVVDSIAPSTLATPSASVGSTSSPTTSPSSPVESTVVATETPSKFRSTTLSKTFSCREETLVRWEEYLHRLEPESRRRYDLHVTTYLNYATTNSLIPSVLSSLHSFIESLRSKGMQANTLRTYLSTLSTYLNLVYLMPKPSESDQYIKEKLLEWKINDKPKECPIFTKEELKNFLLLPENEEILLLKVYLILTVCGLLRISEVISINFFDLTKVYSSVFKNFIYVCTLERKKRNLPIPSNYFLIPGEYEVSILDRYFLSQKYTENSPFLRRIKSNNPLSAKVVRRFPMKIAKFLGKSDPDTYNARSMRVSGLALCSNDSGVVLEDDDSDGE